MRGKSALPLLDFVKLAVNSPSVPIKSYQPLHQSSESDSENMMGVLGRIIITRQHPPLCHIEVGIIHLVIPEVINLVFLIVMVKVVWVLGPPTFFPRKVIIGLVVVIFCHIGVVVIHP